MLTDRDITLLDWLKTYKIITISQCQYLFFNGSYEAARRRLSLLEEQDLIKSYFSQNTKQKVYYLYKKANDKYIYTIDYLKELKKVNCEILDIKINPKYLDNSIKPSAFVKFKNNGFIFNTILQINDFTFIDDLKLNNFYNDVSLNIKDYPEFNNHGFILIMIPSTKTIRISSSNYDCILTNFQYKNLSSLLNIDKLNFL